MAAPGTGHHAARRPRRAGSRSGMPPARGLQAALAARRRLHLRREDRRRRFPARTSTASRRTRALLGSGSAAPALSQTSFKPWCAARQTMAATQALKEILAEGVDAAVIARIGVAVLPPHLKMIDHGVTAGDRFSHLTSVPYQMAVAALAPDAGLWPERAARAAVAGAVGLHGADQGAGRGGPARPPATRGLARPCHGRRRRAGAMSAP